MKLKKLLKYTKNDCLLILDKGGVLLQDVSKDNLYQEYSRYLECKVKSFDI